jgi:hypothetical protein
LWSQQGRLECWGVVWWSVRGSIKHINSLCRRLYGDFENNKYRNLEPEIKCGGEWKKIEFPKEYSI